MLFCIWLSVCQKEWPNMSESIRGNQYHLTLSDRTYIEQEWVRYSTFRSNATVLHKDLSTISKEIFRFSYDIKTDQIAQRCRLCMNVKKCTEQHVCGNDKCTYKCHKCYRKDPSLSCHFFTLHMWKTAQTTLCMQMLRDVKYVSFIPKIFSAKQTPEQYEKTLSKSMEGINLTKEQLIELNDLVSHWF